MKKFYFNIIIKYIIVKFNIKYEPQPLNGEGLNLNLIKSTTPKKKKMSENNNQIQNYSQSNFSNNNQNNNIPVTFRQTSKEMQFLIDPGIFQTSVLNSINNYLSNNMIDQNQIGNNILQIVGKELQDMSSKLIEAFRTVNENINDLRQNCGIAYSEDKQYKDNNNNNIDFLAGKNSALEKKTNELEDSNNNLINTNKRIMSEIVSQTENIIKMNDNINNLNEDHNKSKVQIKENEEYLKKFKGENENSYKELSIKCATFEDKLNKLTIQNEKIINELNIIKKNVSDLQIEDKNNLNLLNTVENDNKNNNKSIDNLNNKYNMKIKEIEEQMEKYENYFNQINSEIKKLNKDITVKKIDSIKTSDTKINDV